jgi:hypothetical protein
MLNTKMNSCHHKQRWWWWYHTKVGVVDEMALAVITTHMVALAITRSRCYGNGKE